MKFLTRQEEMILLAVTQLSGEASLVKIHEFLIQETGREWSVSSVYVPLDRLTRSGLLDARTGKPESRRGGRAVKLYSLTPQGKEALVEMKSLNDTLWRGLNGLITE